MLHLGLFLVSTIDSIPQEATTIDRNWPRRSSSRSLAVAGAGTVQVMVGCFTGRSWKWWADLTARWEWGIPWESLRISENLWEWWGNMGKPWETMGNQHVADRGSLSLHDFPICWWCWLCDFVLSYGFMICFFLAFFTSGEDSRYASGAGRNWIRCSEGSCRAAQQLCSETTWWWLPGGLLPGRLCLLFDSDNQWRHPNDVCWCVWRELFIWRSMCKAYGSLDSETSGNIWKQDATFHSWHFQVVCSKMANS